MRVFGPDGSDRAWEGVPLCCRYLAVHVGLVRTLDRRAQSVSEVTAYWALGTLADGQSEFLGAWHALDSAAFPWSAIFKILEDRGVERIHVVAASHRDIVLSDLSVAFPSAMVMRSANQLARDIEEDMSELAPLI